MTSPASIVYMKTGAGLAESSGKTNTLSALDKAILARVDGKAQEADIASVLELEPEHARIALDFLQQEGLIRPFLSPASSFNRRSGDRRAPVSRSEPNDASDLSLLGIDLSLALDSASPQPPLNTLDPALNLELAIPDSSSGSVDGLSLSARAQSAKRRASRSFQNSAPRQTRPLGPSPLSATVFSPSRSPSSAHDPVADASRAARQARAAKAQQEIRELELERDRSERLALALKEARQRSEHEAREREQAERDRSAKLALALKEAQEQARREAEARERAERELAAAEELRLAREAIERERLAKEALAQEIILREKAEREEREAQERLEAERLAGIERARLRRLGVFKARARIAFASITLAAIAIGAVSINRLIRVTPESCSSALSSWLAMPADVSSCDVSLFPAPAIIATGVLSKDQSIAVKRATLFLSIPSLAWGSKKVKSATLEDARLTSEGLMAAVSSRRLDPSQAGWLESISFENATLTAGSFEIPGLSGSGKFLSDGSFDTARLYKNNPAISMETRLLKGVPTLSIAAQLAPDSSLGLLGFEEATLAGSLINGGISLDELTLRHPAGLVQAKGSIQWANSQWSASGPFEARSLQADRLAPWLFLAGRSSLSGSYSASGPTAESLARSLSAQASGKIASAMVKLDIANAMGFGQTGGVSRFNSVDVDFSYQQRALSLTRAVTRSGNLRAEWSASRQSNGSVSGSLNSSLSSIPGGPMSFSISGNDRKLSLSPLSSSAPLRPASSSDSNTPPD